MQDLQGDDDSAGRRGKEDSGEKKMGRRVGEERRGTQQPNDSRRTEKEAKPKLVLAVLFCNCMALTAAPAINTMGERKRELLVRDHLLTEIIFLLALG